MNRKCEFHGNNVKVLIIFSVLHNSWIFFKNSFILRVCFTERESCSLPVEWDGEWHDSSDTEQDITFNRSSNYVVGWKHTAYSDTITSWTCVDQDTSNNLLLFK